MALLEGWWLRHKAAPNAPVHRVRTLRAFEVSKEGDMLLTICGQYWWPVIVTPTEGVIYRHCLRCVKLQGRYAAHDEEKGT